MVIGIIDSGKGGLAVAKHLKQNKHEIILFMDRAYFPYGNKSKYFLCCRAFYLVRYLIQLKVDVIVIACNTLSIMALPFLKANIDFPIIGVFDYLIPYFNKDSVLIGSKNTVDYVTEHYHIPTMDGTEMIRAIEENKDLSGFIEEIDKSPYKQVIFGCTHLLNLSQKNFQKCIVDQLYFLDQELQEYEKSLGKTKT